MVFTRRNGVELVKKKEFKYMMTEDGLTVGGEHTVQYTDSISQKCVLKTSMILLTNATPINLI